MKTRKRKPQKGGLPVSVCIFTNPSLSEESRRDHTAGVTFDRIDREIWGREGISIAKKKKPITRGNSSHSIIVSI